MGGFRYSEVADMYVPRERLKDRISRHMTALHSVREDPGLYDFQNIAEDKNYLGEHVDGTGDGVRTLKPRLCPGCNALKRDLKGSSGRFMRSGTAAFRSGRGVKGAHRGISRAGKQTVGAYWDI